jgi:hypothetical protein
MGMEKSLGCFTGTASEGHTFQRERARAALQFVQDWQAKLRANGIEPEDYLAELGLDPWGAPLAASTTAPSMVPTARG